MGGGERHRVCIRARWTIRARVTQRLQARFVFRIISMARVRENTRSNVARALSQGQARLFTLFPAYCICRCHAQWRPRFRLFRERRSLLFLVRSSRILLRNPSRAELLALYLSYGKTTLDVSNALIVRTTYVWMFLVQASPGSRVEGGNRSGRRQGKGKSVRHGMNGERVAYQVLLRRVYHLPRTATVRPK